MRNIRSKSLLVLAASSLLLVGCDHKPSSTPIEKPSSTGPISSIDTADFKVAPTLTVEVDQTAALKVTDLVGLTAADFEYSSYNTKIATVAQDGTVTGISEGSTQILIKAKQLRKTVDVTVTDSHKLNGLVSLKKIKNIVALDADASSIDYSGAPLMNIAWDGGTYESTAGKFDFENNAADSAIILRGAHEAEKASIDNGDYVVIMSDDGTDKTAGQEVRSMIYSKTEVSKWANSFRLWGWSSKSDKEESPASGKGKFRISAYEFNETYTEYTSHFLQAKDIGTLSQDRDGWITFDDVSDVLNGTIAGAPENNMFVFDITTDTYDLREKNIVLAIETGAYPNTLGAGNVSVPNRFGIKRMGFMCDAKPDIQLTSEKAVTLYANATSQIAATGIGDAVNGTFTYTSLNPDVATVSAEGLITAADVTAESSTKIKVTNDKAPGKEILVDVTVKPTPSTSFNVPENLTVKAGATVKIEPTDKVNCGAFVYESMSDHIATVAADGTVTAKNVGSVRIKVTNGELIKYVTVNIKTTAQIVGINDATAKDMAGFTATGGFPGAWDFAWSGGVTADKIDSDDTKLETALIHLARTSDGTDSQINIQANDIEIISNIGQSYSSEVVGQVYVKTDISASATSFRAWTRAGTPTEDVSGSMKTRVVVYLPNADYSEYTAYVLPFAAAESYAADSVSNDQVTGIVTVDDNAAGAFLVFSLPEEIKGAQGAIVSIESYSAVQDLQTRQYVRRFGFDA